MKKILLSLFSLLASLAIALPAHATRLHTLSINDAWRFRMEGQEEWQAVHLPHTWNTDAYVVKDYLRGVGTYQRELTIPEEMQGMHLFLRVDAASKTLSVSVNGHSYDLHVGGYNAASYDITEAIDPTGTNLLELVVDNATDLVPPTSADFTFQGGVYRDVWLIATEAQHFSLTDHGAEAVYISTPHVNEAEAEVSVRATVCNEADQRMTLTLMTEIFSPQGSSVTSATRKIKLVVLPTFWLALPNMPADGIPFWDMKHPDIRSELLDSEPGDKSFSAIPRDASAAALIASALYELATYLPDCRLCYEQAANHILDSLDRYYRAQTGSDHGFLLLHSTGHYPAGSEIDVPLVYADYYYLEAQARRAAMEWK